jgi:hypothetical protein
MIAESERRPPSRKTAPDDSEPNNKDSTPGFWDLAATGKVRAICREPTVTHYECVCCRWTA